MIQIIKGTFGYYNGRKVIPITEADGPQKFDDELEARLVKERRRQVHRRAGRDCRAARTRSRRRRRRACQHQHRGRRGP